ncbi:hypothetical protein LZ30DRAFT_714587 [Colletotrichum cereale]|nr:hypothetical protein LZ30DRAFT_714587 [Colletotrichum cereale]
MQCVSGQATASQPRGRTPNASRHPPLCESSPSTSWLLRGTTSKRKMHQCPICPPA